MGSRKNKTKVILCKNKMITYFHFFERIVSKSQNLIKEKKLETCTLVITFLVLFFTVYIYYETDVPKLIFTEEDSELSCLERVKPIWEWEYNEGGYEAPIYSFSLSNPSGGIAVVERIWLETTKVDPIEKLYTYPFMKPALQS